MLACYSKKYCEGSVNNPPNAQGAFFCVRNGHSAPLDSGSRDMEQKGPVIMNTNDDSCVILLGAGSGQDVRARAVAGRWCIGVQVIDII